LSAASTAPEYRNIKAKIKFFIVAPFCRRFTRIPEMTSDLA
jgi:hypothetical protein